MDHSILIIIVAIIMVLQFWVFGLLCWRMTKLKSAFSKPLSKVYRWISLDNFNKDDRSLEDVRGDNIEEENIVRIALVNTEGKNDIILKLEKKINKYLLNNYGAVVNYSIIKETIDNEITTELESISEGIPTPLYLGLAATMFGIIYGLFLMPTLSKNDTELFSGINLLLDGIQIAMFASLLGLAMTTALSTLIYKNIKYKVLIATNDQVSELQSTLLPELVRKEDSGYSALRTSLDQFTREAKEISENLNSTTLKTSKNIEMQHKVIEEINKMDVKKISEVNLELFEQLNKNREDYKEFSGYLNQMALISGNLKVFAQRTVNMEVIAQSINSSITDSQKLYQFLSKHFENVEIIGNSMSMAIEVTHKNLETTLNKWAEDLPKIINEFTIKLNTAVILLESSGIDTIKNIQSGLTNVIIDFSNETTHTLLNLKNNSDTSLGELKEALVNVISDINKSTNEVITSFADNTSKNISDMTKSTNDVITSFADDTSKNIVEGSGKLSDAITSFTGTLTESMENSESKIKETVDSYKNNTISSLDLIKTAISRTINNITDSINLTLEKSNTAFSTEVDKLHSELLVVTSKFIEEVQKKTIAKNDDLSTIDSSYKTLLDNLSEKLDKLTREHLEKINSAYSGLIPNFEEFENLKFLESINDNVLLISSHKEKPDKLQEPLKVKSVKKEVEDSSEKGIEESRPSDTLNKIEDTSHQNDDEVKSVKENEDEKSTHEPVQKTEDGWTKFRKWLKELTH